VSVSRQVWKKGDVLVTGAAGFIGSHLCRRLLAEGATVRGIDSFLDNYPRRTKESNIADLLKDKRFSFFEDDLCTAPLTKLLAEVVAIFHCAALPGVRNSWGDAFTDYLHNNIFATQLLLDSAKGNKLHSFVYVSSSSIYGNQKSSPLKERLTPQPVSPYGVTKLAGEHLALLYQQNYQIPVSIVRLFTVYGPGQRPDMGFYRFIKAVAGDKVIDFYSPPIPSRDFTYIDDIVSGILACSLKGKPGSIYNLGSGKSIPLDKVFLILEGILGKRAVLREKGHQAGDMFSTEADITQAQRRLEYHPRVGIEEGLRRQVEWQLSGKFG
jgi:nucleoside-diphosphate-sugar epimerase